MELALVSNNNLVQSPALLEAKNARWSAVMNIASKVAMVAIVAIALTATSIFLLGLTLTSPLSHIFIGSVLSTPLWMAGYGKASHEADKAARLAEQEKEINDALQQFIALDQAQFEVVCSQLSLDPNQCSYSQEEFNILVARLAYWSRKGHAAHEKANKHIQADHPESELAFDASNISLEQASRLRYLIREKGFEILEKEALPAMLQAALIFHVLETGPQALNLEIGKLHPKTMAARVTELYFENNDTYMTFHDARPPLTRAEILQLFNTGAPTALQQRMFA